MAQNLAIHAQLTAAYPLHDTDMVSSHNDLFKPDNILYDSNHRVWLVDWEAAFLNNRYLDLAVVANLLVTNEEEEMIFLEHYFGQTPTKNQRAQFFLTRQLSHVFYAFGYLFLAARTGQPPLGPSTPIPDFADFHRRLWSGEISLSDQPTKTLYPHVHLQQLRQTVQTPRFNESIKQVA